MRKTKSISFDLSDEYEKELLEYAEKQSKYFSRYMKRLIDRDKNKIMEKPVYNVAENVPEVEDSDVEDMTSLL